MSSALMDMADAITGYEETRRELARAKDEIARLELREEVLRDWVNHVLRQRNENGPIGLLFLHIDASRESSCPECSRLVSTFFPDQPWRGWAL